MIKRIKEFISILKREWAGAFTLMLCAFIGSCTAGLITGCATARKLFPEATKEASTVAPELQQATDSKAAETIKKGKAEGLDRLEKL